MKDFSTYNFEDFITDDSFINYSNRLNPEDIKLWEDWLATNPDYQKTTEEAKDFINQLTSKRQSLPKSFIDNEWKRLSKNLGLNNNKKVPAPGKFRIKIWQYAAAILILISVSGILITTSISNQRDKITYNEILVPRGQMKNILLPDKSLVFLNSDTRLRYSTGFGKKNREVFLEGEAYFEVAHDSRKPFIVHTCENDIEVLGTAFDVKAYPDGNIHQTSLVRGTVRISYQNKESCILNPNQIYLLIRDSKSSKVFMTETVGEYSSWTEGKIILRNSRFTDIAKDIERSHKLIFDIQNEQIRNCRYTGEFSTKDDIRTILGIICMTSPFDYEIAGDTVIIR
jgi:ferric-dicitrate binding protein FerR (iron transport regulator)